MVSVQLPQGCRATTSRQFYLAIKPLGVPDTYLILRWEIIQKIRSSVLKLALHEVSGAIYEATPKALYSDSTVV